MIDERKFLDLCKAKGVEPFKVTTELDETDIFLDTEDINDFFRVCECYGMKCVFYSYVQQTKETYKLDQEKIIWNIKEFIESEGIRNHYNPFGFADDVIDFDYLIDKYSAKIDEIVEKQNELIEAHVWGTPLMLEVFISCNGDRIGMTIFNDEIQAQGDLKWNNELIEELKRELEEEIELLYAENSRSKAAMYEKERKEREIRYNKAIEEIKTMLQTSDRLMDCTNGKLRHAYARDLANDFSEKYDCYITIGEVDALVEEEYRKYKNNKR